jgi:hypothetical protein
MTDFTHIVTRTPDEILQHVEAAKRLRTAIIAAQIRRRTPKLEAVMCNDGILIADFYGIKPGGMNSRFGSIHAQFDYDEMEEAIEFVEAM